MILPTPTFSQTLQLSGTYLTTQCGVWAVPYFAGDGKNVMYEIRDCGGFNDSGYGLLYIHVIAGESDKNRVLLPSDIVQKVVMSNSDVIRHVDSSGTVTIYHILPHMINYCEYANDVISLVKGYVTDIPKNVLEVIQQIDGYVKL